PHFTGIRRYGRVRQDVDCPHDVGPEVGEELSAYSRGPCRRHLQDTDPVQRAITVAPVRFGTAGHFSPRFASAFIRLNRSRCCAKRCNVTARASPVNALSCRRASTSMYLSRGNRSASRKFCFIVRSTPTSCAPNSAATSAASSRKVALGKTR